VGEGQTWTAIEITPDPSPEELAALTIALARLTAREGAVNAHPVSAWAMAGRRESLFGRRVATRTGWERGVPRVSRW
jgi:hypothetical protein